MHWTTYTTTQHDTARHSATHLNTMQHGKAPPCITQHGTQAYCPNTGGSQTDPGMPGEASIAAKQAAPKTMKTV